MTHVTPYRPAHSRRQIPLSARTHVCTHPLRVERHDITPVELNKDDGGALDRTDINYAARPEDAVHDVGVDLKPGRRCSGTIVLGSRHRRRPPASFMSKLPLLLGLAAVPLGGVVGRVAWAWFANPPPVSISVRSPVQDMRWATPIYGTGRMIVAAFGPARTLRTLDELLGPQFAGV
jgi:hypothetical protein